jgi:hypothetical protein
MATRAFEAPPLLTFACALALVALSPVEAQKVAPVGFEFQVNSYTPEFQHEPAIASDGDGDFVVVWTGENDGSNGGIFGQRFSSAGARVAVEFQINSHTPEHQNRPAVAAAADGRFVVAWQSFLQ